MKKLTTYFCISMLAMTTFCLTSCSTRKTQEVPVLKPIPPPSPPARVQMHYTEPIPSFLKGTWALRDYVDSVLSCRSTYRCSNLLHDATEIAFFPNMDSMEVIYDQHDGLGWHAKASVSGNDIWIDEPGNSVNLWHFQYAPGSPYLLYINGSSSIYFQKISSDPADGLDGYINARLLAGRYRLVYPDSSKMVFVFDSSGTIQGWGQYNGYSVFLDYIDNIPQRDLIYMRRDSTWEILGYHFSGNALQLYKFNTGAEGPVEGDTSVTLSYTLERENVPAN